jgi:hypothetical protein
MTMTNLGAIESRKRTIFGASMLMLGIILSVALFFFNLRGPWLLALFIPFWLGTLGLLQGGTGT